MLKGTTVLSGQMAVDGAVRGLMLMRIMATASREEEDVGGERESERIRRRHRDEM